MLEEKKSGSNSIILQASILAAAGIITRIIGLLYRSPLSGIIGDLGLGYYQSAYNYYTIILLISSYSIPSAISKVIAQKLAVQEYKNAHRLFKGALFYVLVIGAVASAFLYFAAGLFVEEAAIPVLRTFAPTIFFYGMLGVLRGYFQAHKTMVQTSVSQILEQIANAIVSVGAAYFLIKMTMGTMEIPADEAGQVTRAVRGAMGSALGTGTGVMVALLFMFLIYLKAHKEIKGRVAADTHKESDSVGTIIKTITLIVTPFIMSTALYNLSSVINNKLYTSIYPSVMHLDTVITSSRYGIFSGKALTISNIPIAFASAMASAMIPSIAQLVAKKEDEEARSKISLAVKTTMLISIPCAVGLFVLAGPVTLLLFPNSASNYELSKYTLMALSVSVIFYALSTLNSSILQGLGKVNTPILNAAIALIVQTATACGLLFFTGFDVYSIAIANTLYSFIMAILNQMATRRAIGYKQEIKRTFILPLLASFIMGAAAYGVYRLVYYFVDSRRIAVIPAIIVAIPVYFIALLLVKGVNETELKAFPKGRLIIKIAKKLRLLR
ncbi:MAG: polysaccharide biosynthesis protein [Lachnospiraceae bacterium]|nr:polysaccharide biosynthesis protein [Lachnospiraceae bacterium]